MTFRTLPLAAQIAAMDAALARAYLDGTEKVTRSKQELQLAYKAWKEGNLTGFIPYSGARQ